MSKKTATSMSEAAATVQNAIRNLNSYEEFVEAKQKVENDPEIQEQKERVQSLQQDCLLARQAGTLTDEQVEELEAARSQLHEFEAVQRYQHAHEELTQQLENLNDSISDGLEVDFGNTVGNCCRED